MVDKGFMNFLAYKTISQNYECRRCQWHTEQLHLTCRCKRMKDL
jgi:hypothetical protein